MECLADAVQKSKLAPSDARRMTSSEQITVLARRAAALHPRIVTLLTTATILAALGKKFERQNEAFAAVAPTH